jgi:hypothetical protein
MRTFNGGENVKGGYYFNLREWRLDVIEGARGPLAAPGHYVRIPVLLMLALAPLMGMVFVMLIPFVGLAVVIEHVGRWTYKTMTVRRRAPLRG